MANSHGTINQRTYTVTWFLLLALTLIMLATEAVPLPVGLLFGVLLAGMLVKAGLIGANFMHLRFERPSLQWTVFISLFVLGAIMFIVMAIDAMHVRDVS